MASNSYTRMALVRPDLLEKNAAAAAAVPAAAAAAAAATAATAAAAPPSNAQTAFYESQLVRERLSPNASLVQILSHLQKEAYKILYDTSLKSSDKLRQYNQLMIKSAIIMKKAKTVGRAAANFNPAAVMRRRETPDFSPPPVSSDLDTDSESTDDTWADARAPSLTEGASGGEELEEEEDLGPLSPHADTPHGRCHKKRYATDLPDVFHESIQVTS